MIIRKNQHVGIFYKSSVSFIPTKLTAVNHKELVLKMSACQICLAVNLAYQLQLKNTLLIKHFICEFYQEGLVTYHDPGLDEESEEFVSIIMKVFR